MDKRWSVEIGGVVSFVTPQNIVSFTDERDLSKGQIFYRRKISGPLNFVNPDFALFQAIERVASRRCEKILIRLELLCGGQWQEYWRGQFSTGSGSFDLSRCTFSVKPEVVDRYTCLLGIDAVKYNILQAGKVTTNAIVLPSLEFASCYISGGYPVGCEPYQVDGWTIGTTATLPGCDLDPPDQFAYVFWREKVMTECVGGNPAPPPGVGWSLLVNDCAVNGTATYVRPPSISWTFGSPVIGYTVDGAPLPPDNDCLYQYAGTVIGSPFCDPYPIFVCLTAAESLPVTGTRKVEDALEYILGQVGCDLQGVRSDLFYWDPVGDAPGFINGLDYVTGRATQIDQLTIAQKTDVADPLPSNPATIGEISFQDFMKMLNVMFRVFWDIDDEGYLRVEHWKYWTGEQGIDLTDYDSIEPLSYSHLTERIPQAERVSFMEAQGRDFVGVDIVYSGPCVTEQDAQEYSPGKVTTDVSFVFSDPTNIARDGFVMFATSFDGSEYNVIIDNGAITGNFTSNAPLSVANLERDYWTWDRYLPTGRMNGLETTFNGYLPNIQQGSVSVPICCDVLFFDAKDRITGNLSELLDVPYGIVESSSFNLQSSHLSLSLRYSY